MNDIKPELDIVFESVLYRAISLGYPRRRAEDLARQAVLDYFNTSH